MDTLESFSSHATDIQSKCLDSMFKILYESLTSVRIGEENSIVSGESIGDIPSTYKISGLLQHERPVIGTFVHQDIVPGFRYRVRLNGTGQYLFDNRPLLLETTGQGYGKRLTFECEDILQNTNYFWSDSFHLGYGFSISVLDAGAQFDVFENGLWKGSCQVLDVSKEQEILTSRNDIEKKEHVKEVLVRFSANFLLQKEKEFSSDVVGCVEVSRGVRCHEASVRQIHVLLNSTKRSFLLKSVL